METSLNARPRPWYFDPRVIIVAGCLVAVISFGARSTMGFFTKPITEFHQWDREVYGLAMAAQNLVWGIFQPIAGGFADRYGPVRVLAAGALIYALGLFLMPLSHTPLAILASGGIVTGIGIATASFAIVMAAFAGWCRRRSAPGPSASPPRRVRSASSPSRPWAKASSPPTAGRRRCRSWPPWCC